MANIIGLTGGIASGKSTVSALLQEKGYTIIDADLAARMVVEVGQPAYLAIVEAFGKGILQENGQIDRAGLGAIIFNDQTKRNLLNGIVHPAVRSMMLSHKDEAVENGKQTIIMDIPLLFESDLTWMVDRTIVVTVEKDVQLSRLMKRNKMTEEEAASRISSQLPLREKVEKADAVIDNNGSVEDTLKQVEELLTAWGLKP
ncbi:dephospho-CoA kinase [Rossellomorea marisflavi]|uniref:Dephospho-CoA kinase n=1 Tax=Rossellomorea marisflavi TaxID=189381 RepID=A0A5D4S4F5_9BACI|nr:dephospho-CoA kinase [Rossellomorea marisflavi]KQU60853.1 dephospho-CoA kinase [Bacillus sp. Leaf406]MDW4527626.1 dephospho-CoA kinase [Rossellomorea marisflavi]TYS57058.1 dephospho-CoA kinase [Rossellomorea marisflavi]UKS64279.1 dephospho-CoA kinase [Rossellomorea marisflavi]WJV20095.1 dephospho-CoA kinase [Rossellomorea marisflavi]